MRLHPDAIESLNHLVVLGGRSENLKSGEEVDIICSIGGIKGLGKAKCLKKMAQKRVVLSLTILLHR